MGIQSIIVLLVILMMIILLYKELLRPTITFVVSVMILLIAGIISPSEALHGFANEQLAVIIMLLILRQNLDVCLQNLPGRTTTVSIMENTTDQN